VNLSDPLIVGVSPEQDGSHLRQAYLSHVLSERDSVVEATPSPDGPPPQRHNFTVSVDAGTVAFVDAEALPRCLPAPATWYEEVF
jgi:hypothetical protein